MNRRQFIALGAAALTMPVARMPVQADPLMSLWEKGWDFAISRNDESMWWQMLAEYRPTGVKYGWTVSSTYLVNKNTTPEAVLARLVRGVNPHYLS